MTDYVKEELLYRMHEGRSVRSICRDEDMPSQATVFRYLAGKSEDHAEFREQYARALMFRTYYLAEMALDVALDEEHDFETRKNAKGEEYVAANPTSVQRARLKCDELHWHIERLNGVKYGRPLQIDPNGAGDRPIIMRFIDYRDLPDEPVINKRPPNLTIDRRGGGPPPATAFDDEDDF